MAVTVACPDCDVTLPVSEALLGKKIRCKSCQATFVATAAKVPVGGAGGQKATKTAPRRPTALKKSAKNSGNGTIMWMWVGGGVAAATVIGVGVWAAFFRTDNTEKTGQQPASNSQSGSGVAVNDSTPTSPPNNDKPTTPPATTKADTAAKAAPAVPPTPKQAWFVESPARLPFNIDPKTVERLKRSSCWIKCDGATGSGWCAEPGIFITNSHVVGMKEPAAPPPKSVSIVLNPGLPDEKTYPTELLGLDRDNDLAILKITGDNLPLPMPIARSSEIREGQRLYTVGFPFGNQMEKGMQDETGAVDMRVKVRQCTVAGRLTDRYGSVKYIQTEGGADPGNSGGMIVDPAGHVRCVLVAGLPGTNLRFTIPSEYAVYLLRGRMLKVVPGQPFLSGDKTKLPLTALVADPMKRIEKIALEVWAGEPGKKSTRPGGDDKPSPQPSDSARQVVTLPFDTNARVNLGEAHEIRGEVDLPALREGHVYWVQPRYTGFDGQTRWGEAVVMNTAGTPVERKPANLAIRHQANTEFAIDLDSRFAVGATPEHGELHLHDQGMLYKLTEKTVAVLPDGSGKVSIKYNDVRYTNEDIQDYVSSQVKGLLATAKGMLTEMTVSKSGRISKPTMDMKKVPIPIRSLMERFNTQTIQSLEALSLALPEREVQPGETWQSDANYTVMFSRITENALFKMNYRYMGTRVRNGHEEAVIEFEGQIVRGQGNDVLPPPARSAKGEKGKADPRSTRLAVRNMYGKARGAALVDLKTGLVTLARSEANMELDAPFAHMGNIKFGLGQRVIMHRHVNGPTAAGSIGPDPTRLLPNIEVVLQPMVGAPETAVGQNP